MEIKEAIKKDVKVEFFYKILLKPFILILIFSLWPFMVYILPWFPFPFLLGLSIQILLVVMYFVLFIKFIKYKKFPSFVQAKNYYTDLKKVKILEQKAKKTEAQKFNFEIKKRKIEMEEAKINKLQIDLEERKKKLL
jgi:hypothetical protein